MAAIERTPVESSNLLSAGYDSETKTLEIQFKDGKDAQAKPGAVYQYHDVPSSVWDDFQGAESKGRYFHQAIKKGGFGFTKISG